MGKDFNLSKTVAVIESHTEMQLVLQVVLKSLGYRVLLVSSNFDQLVLAMRNGLNLDVCILSLDNSAMLSGLVCQELRNHCPSIKIVAVCMNNSLLVKEKAMACKFDGFYSKGEPIESLVSILEDFRA